MSLDGGFGADARLTRRPDFQAAIRGGRRYTGPNVTIWQVAGPAAEAARLGLSVGRKVGSAVRRNRIKRLLRETFRLNRGRFTRGLRLVASPKPGCSWRKLSETQAELLSLIGKGGGLSC